MKLKLMEGKALAKLIGQIGTARVKLDEQIQLAAVHCIGQSIVHRNTTPANSLLEAASKHHKATLVAYLEKYGNFEWDRKAELLKFRDAYPPAEGTATEEFFADHVAEVIGDAKWYDAKKPAKVVSQYDAVEVLSAQFERLLKAKAKGTTVVNAPILEATYAAFCAAVGRAYEDREYTDAEKAVNLALDARTKGLASPAQLKMLAEHFGRPVPQVEFSPKAETFGGTPKAVNQ